MKIEFDPREEEGHLVTLTGGNGVKYPVSFQRGILRDIATKDMPEAKRALEQILPPSSHDAFVGNLTRDYLVAVATKAYYKDEERQRLEILSQADISEHPFNY